VLVAVLMLGAGMVVHSAYTVSTARREPSSFSVPTSAAVAAPQATKQAATHSPGPSHSPARPHQPAAAEFVATRLHIPALQVDAAVVPVVSADRTLTPPENPRQVGWWVASALAGSRIGSVVVAGHIDSAASGPGALFRLDQIKAGQTINLSDRSNTVQYRATSMRFYPKSAGLPAALFHATGPAQLVLVSCGGTFDRAKRSYRSNVVVIAAPAKSVGNPNGSQPMIGSTVSAGPTS
jgi:sortase (surface protein transpeptidase)